MGLREQKRERQRQAIIDTSITMFAESGFEGTRVRDIAQRLQISEPTFFNYFPTKQAVVDAAVDHHLGPVLDAMGRLDDSAPVLDQVVDLMSEAAVIVMADPQFIKLLRLDARFDLGGGRVREAYERLASLLAAGQRQGQLRQDITPGHLAEILITAVLAALNNRLIAPDVEMTGEEFGVHVRQRLEETWAILCYGMKADPLAATPEPAGPVARGRRR